MNETNTRKTFLAALGLVAGVLGHGLGSPALANDAPRLRVIATVPDLGAIAHQVAGKEIDLTVITKGPEDAHFSQPKPSFIKALHEADAFLLVGMDFELGYAPSLLQSARNARVLPNAPGYVDASLSIRPIEVPATTVDRSMGDVHAQGNPHYLADPMNGLRVAKLVRDRFATLRPADAERYRVGYRRFHDAVGAALYGAEVAEKYDVLKLGQLDDLGKLESFLESQGDLETLGGWRKRMLPFAGTRVVDDHRIWPYFARRFGIEIFADMEPIPGVPPTTRHLQDLVDRMRAAGVRVIVTSPYYDRRHARFVAEATGAKVVQLAHQTGSRKGADSYVAMIDHNVEALASALAPPP